MLDFQPEGHLYVYNGKLVPCVSDILEHFGLSDFSRIHRAVLDASQKFGNNVHKTCELYDRDDLDSCDIAVQPYLNNWIKCRQDNGISNFDIIEKPMYSKVWGFAGTPDRVHAGILDDIKTGVATPAHAIQTALYQILVEENTGRRIKHRRSIHLSDSKYKIIPHKNKQDLVIAKSLLTIYKYKKEKGLIK